MQEMQKIDQRQRPEACRSATQEIAGDDDDDDELNYRSWLAKIVKSLLDSRVGYPYYSPAYVCEHIDKPTTSREELHQYRTTAEPTRSAYVERHMLFLWSLTYLIKSIVWPFVILREFDLKNPESNVIMLTNDTYRFGCLVSNCTNLGQSAQGHDTNAAAETNENNNTINLEQLSETLFELPYLSLCHPMLANLYDPTQHLGPIDSMLAALVGVMLTLGSPFSLLRDFYKADNMMLMFLVAPRVTRQVVKEQAKDLLYKLKVSRDNFKILDIEAANKRERKADQHSTASGFCEVLQNTTATQTQLDIRTELTRDPDLAPVDIRISPVGCLPELTPLEFKTYVLQSSRDSSAIATASKKKLHERLETQLEIEEEKLQKLEQLDEASAFAAQDCVSVMRSAWWRARALNRILVMSVAVVISVLLAYAFSFYLVLKFVPEEQVKLNEIGSKADNCSIWLIDDQQTDDNQQTPPVDHYPSDPSKQFKLSGQVHLDRLQLETSSMRTILYILQYSLAFVAYSTFGVIFLTTCEEITGWLCEVKFELTLGTEFVKQLVGSFSGQFGACRPLVNQNEDIDARQNISPIASKCRMAHTRPYQYQHFKMAATIRSKFKPLAGLSFIVNDCKLMGNDCLPTSSYLESVQAIEEYVKERIEADRLCLCSAVDLLEKLHTSFGILVEHVRCYDRTMTIMIVCANMYNYFVIFTILIYIQSVKGYLLFPSIVLFTSWLFINLIIVIASNFHAKANKLHSLIWTLLAVTSECSDIRIRHMRHLWLKQVLALDSDGGLSLRALGLRITYTNIIQLVVISGTIVVFMLR